MIIRQDYLKKLRLLKDNNHIKVLTGIRRSGKTCLLKMYIRELINEGVKTENIIYISFEDIRYSRVKNDVQLDEIIIELTRNLSGKIYMFFDEIQNVENWERSVNSYNVSFDADIYITGSNSTLLSGDLATLLTGRYVEIHVYPFSYKEVLQYYSQKKSEGLSKSEEKEIFDYYVEYGGFPGLLYQQEEVMGEHLIGLYNTILVNDIFLKNKVSDIDLFERLFQFVADNIGNLFSADSIRLYLKSEHRETSTPTIINYLNYATKSFILYKAQREDLIGKRKLKISEKYYLADSSFYSLLTPYDKTSRGQILENIVYIELLRRGYSVTIGKIKEYEVDFVCRKLKKKIYLQVSETIMDPKTREREMKSLEKIKDQYPKFVITEDTTDYSYNGIQHMNIIDFLKLEEF